MNKLTHSIRYVHDPSHSGFSFYPAIFSFFFPLRKMTVFSWAHVSEMVAQ